MSSKETGKDNTYIRKKVGSGDYLQEHLYVRFNIKRFQSGYFKYIHKTEGKQEGYYDYIASNIVYQ